LAVPSGVPNVQQSVQGIVRYAAQHGHWSVAVSAESPIVSFAGLRNWAGDGVVAMLNTPADAKLVAGLGIPAVNISGALDSTDVPRVTADNYAIGKQAAEHLLECGFRRFAYYGLRGVWYAQQRGEGFCDAIDAAGGACSIFLAPPTLGRHPVWAEVDQRVCKWLKSLAPPVGILASCDYRARLILEACNQLGLRVPDDLGLLGVDNDSIACELCDPMLSSVSRDSEREGYEAAALLDRLMAGHAPPRSDVLIPPTGVVRRRSTNIVAIDNTEVAAAVRYMCHHLNDPITTNDIVQRLGLSRRWLEQAFRRSLGHTPHTYLNFLRIRRARQLLVEEPKMALYVVARECGFSDTKRLRLAFMRFVGVVPSEYRRVHCGNGDHA
jgi:LacI family transcriptional regulator